MPREEAVGPKFGLSSKSARLLSQEVKKNTHDGICEFLQKSANHFSIALPGSARTCLSVTEI